MPSLGCGECMRRQGIRVLKFWDFDLHHLGFSKTKVRILKFEFFSLPPSQSPNIGFGSVWPMKNRSTEMNTRNHMGVGVFSNVVRFRGFFSFSLVLSASN